MNVHNRTPHPITILAADGVTVVASLPAAQRGEVARVETTTETDGRVGGIPIMRTRWGQIVGLPEYEAGTYHVVSVIVAEAAVDSGRNCDDLLVPGDQVRDARGRIVGCRGLTRAVTSSPAMSGQRAHKVAAAIHLRTDPEAQNCRPDPEALAVEAEHLLSAFDSWVKEAQRMREEGGWCHNASEAHGALRCGILGLVRRTVTKCLAEPLDGMSPAEVRQHALSRLIDVLGDRAGDLPVGHSGREYYKDFNPPKAITFPTLKYD